MGLYLDFEVDQSTGRQIGTLQDGTISCPGIVNADKQAEKWKNGKNIKTTKGYFNQRVSFF